MSELEENKISEYINNSLDYFHTSSLGCAAALITIGFESFLVDISRNKEAVFVFPRSGDMDYRIKEYWNNTLEVKSRSFIDNIRNLERRTKVKIDAYERSN